jgi:hypothetical protein
MSVIQSPSYLLPRPGQQPLGWHGPDLTGNLSSTAQQKKGGDALGLEAGGHPRGLVDVDFDGLELPGQLPGYPLNRGRDHPARPAPRRPEVHQYGHSSCVCHLGEVGVARGHQPRQRSLALATARDPGRGRRYAVALSAARAANDAVVEHAQQRAPLPNRWSTNQP